MIKTSQDQRAEYPKEVVEKYKKWVGVIGKRPEYGQKSHNGSSEQAPDNKMRK